MIQSLSLLTVLAQATVPNFDPTLEDLKLFEYRRQVGRKRHISFRASALVVKSAMKFGKLSPQIGPIEEKPPVVRKRFSIRKRYIRRYTMLIFSVNLERRGYFGKQ